MEAKAYIFDRVEASTPTVMLEVPFTVRGKVDSAEFHEIAKRDFGIIMNFTRKYSLKSGFSVADSNDIIDQAKFTVYEDAAFVRSFFMCVDAKRLEAICDIMYEECVANLPTEWRKGGLKTSSVLPETPKKKKPRQQELPGVCNNKFYGRVLKKLKGYEDAVEEVVPTPSEAL